MAQLTVPLWVSSPQGRSQPRWVCKEGRLGGRLVPGQDARQPGVSLPELTVRESAPAPVVKSGNLVGQASWGMAVWEREAGKGLRGGSWGAHRGEARPAGTQGTSSPGWPQPVASSDITVASAASPAPTSFSVGRSSAPPPPPQPLSSLGKCGESLLGWREEKKEGGKEHDFAYRRLLINNTRDEV